MEEGEGGIGGKGEEEEEGMRAEGEGGEGGGGDKVEEGAGEKGSVEKGSGEGGEGEGGGGEGGGGAEDEEEEGCSVADCSAGLEEVSEEGGGTTFFISEAEEVDVGSFSLLSDSEVAALRLGR